MARQKQGFVFLDPQPTLTTAGTAQQFTSDELWVTSFVIKNPSASDNIYIADSSSNASGTNRETIAAGDKLCVEADKWGNLNAYFDLSELWFDGDSNGQTVVLYYQDYPGTRFL